jgi:NAD(P)-dependent dehydrogenase (short-subunit alcohol dehydrogenase family)
MGTPADVAGVCLFLVSPLAGYVSGAAVEAHGGGEWPPFLAAVEAAEAERPSGDRPPGVL